MKTIKLTEIKEDFSKNTIDVVVADINSVTEKNSTFTPKFGEKFTKLVTHVFVNGQGSIVVEESGQQVVNLMLI